MILNSMLRVGVATVCFLLITGPVSAQTQSPDDFKSWTIVSVPGTWEGQSEGALAEYDGFAWYRCLITVPGSWKGKELRLEVEQIDDAHEAYFNGVKIGGAGSLGPEARGQRSEVRRQETKSKQSARYTIAAEHVRPGDDNLLSIRVYGKGGRGGFKGPAPVIVAGNTGINLNGLWEFRIGDDLEWAKGPAALTTTGIFWRVMDAEAARQLAASGSKPLSPDEALKRFVVPDDLEIELVLSEPTVRQPVFMNWDERGRMWVVQYIQYPSPSGLRMVSKDKYWRAVYDKVPPPPPHQFPGADKITIHEDTDGDGIYDKHKTFVDGLNIATACARGRGGVWVLNPPYLLFYPDRNNDDVPDGDPEVHLQGFGLEDTHSVVNSLRWGPDGWLYGAQGSTVSGNVYRPGLDKPENAVRSMGQLIWRYHPDTRRYEIFAEGGGNAHGLEIDSKGRVYSGHNGGNTRGFHYVQGGYFQKGFSKHGPLSNPYAFGYFPPMKHHQVPRFTHDFAIYEGGALPEPYRGRLFGVEPLQGQVVQSEVLPDGSSFKTRDINRVIKTDDPQFRPVDIDVGPDGAIYVADFYEPQISHREHFSGQIDKSTGRIYRLKAKGAKPLQPFDLSRKSTRELIDVLKHPNKWFRQEALRLIGDRKDASVVPMLRDNIESHTGQFAWECLWALNLSGGFDEEFAAKTLQHDDPFVRLWTVRLLCDDRQVSDPIAGQIAALAENESYVQVRSQLACSARRLPAKQCLPVVRALLKHDEDVQDIHLPLLLWWAIESQCGSARNAVLAVFNDPAVWAWPMVKEHIVSRLMRRFAQAGSRQDLTTCARLFQLAPDAPSRQLLLKGFEQAFQGRSLADLPPELSRALAELGGGSPVLGIRQGNAEAIRKALAVIADPQADKTTRLELIQTFGEVDEARCVPVLLQVVRPGEQRDQETDAERELRMAALVSLSRYDDAKVADQVIRLYNDFSKGVRTAAQTLLASRRNWSRQWLEAVDAGHINPDSVPLDVVRKMTVHQDERIAALIRKHWADVEGASTAEMQQRIAHYSDVISSGSGDPYGGKRLFSETCAKCHTLFGEGGRVGPDLTSYNRDDVLNVLINIVNPSAEIREGFESHLVLTQDGRVVTGFLYDQDNQVVVIRGADGQNITIPRDRIEQLLPQKKSLMPELLLKDLSDQDVRDLFAYLRSAQPLNN